MPHDGWLDMAKPFISAYKAGASSPNSYITSDQLIYWYRPTLKSLDCDATDTTMVAADNASGNYFMGRPDGSDSMQDAVFIVALLTSAGKVTVTSGSNTQAFDAAAGASAFQVPMAVGSQKFTLTRNGTIILSDTSLKDISNVCPCGIFNFNAYVGSVPAGFSDPLGTDGLASLTVGLHVSTCSATPSLGTATNIGTTVVTSVTSSPVSPASTSMSSIASKPTSSPSSTAVTYTPIVTSISSMTTVTGTCGCTSTITASSQIFPTNCLQGGEFWRGPAGQATPDCCYGAKPCCRSS